MASTDPRIATQGQWEDLISKVKSAAGSVKELTSADYNYPTSGTATSVALWLLPPGIYCNATGATISESTTSTTTNSAYFIVDPVQNYSGTNYIQIYRLQSIVSIGRPILLTQVVAETGVLSVTKSVLLSDDIVDSLASSSSSLALSANQGRVLDSKIPVVTLQTTDPGEGVALAANNFIGVYGGDPIIMDYSTSEVNTGAKWIDGETIFKKTINIGSLPNNTTSTVAHNITSLNQLIRVEGSFTNGTNSAPIPYAAPTASKSVQVYVDGTNITIGTGEDRSAYSGYVTLYYTKSS